LIYDCFTYYNEIEILELRLRTLAGVVDYFVLVEADRTFSGKKRDFDFAAHRETFSEFAAKIIYVQVCDMPEGKDEWTLQYFQRNCIMRGLTGCSPEGSGELEEKCWII
jgi:beta-1,4-mannosyl-glycoprotein beta-1,4-N-acetylglucosaminyltransferase